MIERGFVIGGTRLIKRAWRIYVAHVLLFVMYIAEIAYLAQRYNDPNLENEFNVAYFMRNPAECATRLRRSTTGLSSRSNLSTWTCCHFSFY